MVGIVTDESVRSGAPRIEETRITVLDVKRRVVDGNEDPFAVAAEYDLGVAAVFEALAYYYDNVETMREREAADEQRRERLMRESADRRTRLAGEDGGPEIEST
ncbi:DUF433 domain-containing protein [Halobellus ordinarius]|uniref:DUF433 domain-containing protein n=1 Tax=Halobellus ordinarius TaxID=3075120 RepID=UPI0028806606|nr:DUF433 domain-containing protein [Halobellus sp. ZY16]